jgi:hypothetical protein
MDENGRCWGFGGNMKTNKYWGTCLLLAATACGPKTMHDVGDLETGGSSPAGSEGGATGGGGGKGTAAGGDDGGESPADNGGSTAAPAPTWPTCRCTRREPELRCPPPSGVSQVTVIGPEGGRAHLDVGSSSVTFFIEFPARASREMLEVSLTETTLEPPAGFVDYSPVYLAAAAPETAESFLPIQLPYGNRDGSIGRALAIYTFSTPGEEPTRLADSYVNAGFLQGSTSKLGYFFAGYPIEAEVDCP